MSKWGAAVGGGVGALRQAAYRRHALVRCRLPIRRRAHIDQTATASPKASPITPSAAVGVVCTCSLSRLAPLGPDRVMQDSKLSLVWAQSLRLKARWVRFPLSADLQCPRPHPPTRREASTINHVVVVHTILNGLSGLYKKAKFARHPPPLSQHTHTRFPRSTILTAARVSLDCRPPCGACRGSTYCRPASLQTSAFPPSRPSPKEISPEEKLFSAPDACGPADPMTALPVGRPTARARLGPRWASRWRYSAPRFRKALGSRGSPAGEQRGRLPTSQAHGRQRFLSLLSPLTGTSRPGMPRREGTIQALPQPPRSSFRLAQPGPANGHTLTAQSADECHHPPLRWFTPKPCSPTATATPPVVSPARADCSSDKTGAWPQTAKKAGYPGGGHNITTFHGGALFAVDC